MTPHTLVPFLCVFAIVASPVHCHRKPILLVLHQTSASYVCTFHKPVSVAHHPPHAAQVTTATLDDRSSAHPPLPKPHATLDHLIRVFTCHLVHPRSTLVFSLQSLISDMSPLVSACVLTKRALQHPPKLGYNTRKNVSLLTRSPTTDHDLSWPSETDHYVATSLHTTQTASKHSIPTQLSNSPSLGASKQKMEHGVGSRTTNPF
ncbi:hypothetical protein RHMOL_Rhmol10G0185400 [Rhododendron molle]|uniref:Uncharacterized protein n=1 Tax=Rhododendron molle TaxID=49168 RepID=A0ACC0M3Y4_RHOML|nr:hypothetical protein RHMOL_Rhmol10G0185400 [Rhododendron molle]